MQKPKIKTKQNYRRITEKEIKHFFYFPLPPILQKPELLVFPPPESRPGIRKQIDPQSHHEVVLKLTEVLVDEGRTRRNSIHIEVGALLHNVGNVGKKVSEPRIRRRISCRPYDPLQRAN